MIKKFTGTVTHIIDLSPTAKEVVLALSEPLDFEPGSFVNMFMDINGERIRRAYSISSSPKNREHISLSIRLNPYGTLTPLFWNTDLMGATIDLMGPLGLNTANHMRHQNIFLFGFGVGAGVVRSLAEYFKDKEGIKSITVMTGSRTEHDVLHKKDFEQLHTTSPKIQVSHVISQPEEHTSLLTGYIQHHISSLNFNHADVFICGQQQACDELVEAIRLKNPTDCTFFVEGFH